MCRASGQGAEKCSGRHRMNKAVHMNHYGKRKTDTDPMAQAALYSLRRDALYIVASQNRGSMVTNETVKRQTLFIQSQLVLAAVADPLLSALTKDALVRFHASCISEDLRDRRGAYRRGQIVGW